MAAQTKSPEFTGRSVRVYAKAQGLINGQTDEEQGVLVMDRDWMNTFGYMAYQNEREQDDRSRREERHEPAREDLHEGLPLNLLVGMSSLVLLTVWAVILI